MGNEKRIWDFLLQAGTTKAGAAGVIGNLIAESGCTPNQVECLCLQRLRESGRAYTNETYTEAVDSGDITRAGFCNPLPGCQYGYGLCQWTYPSRKGALYDLVKRSGKSIGDLDAQLEYLVTELQMSFQACWKILTSSESVETCTDAFLLDFERPADPAGQKPRRRENAKQIMDRFEAGEEKSMDFSKYKGMISNSGSDERGKISGGQAGDQTGGEWRVRTWYDRPWNCILRHPNQAVRQKIAELSVKAAQNENVGYNQYNRDSYWRLLQEAGYDPSRISAKCDADCSAGVISNTKAAGFILGLSALQNISATYTGNMRKIYQAAGFQVLTDRKYLTGWQYLETGDILLNDVHHTAVYVGPGSAAASAPASASASSPAPSVPDPDQAGAGTDVSVFKKVQAATLTSESQAKAMALSLTQKGIRSYHYKKGDFWFVACGSWPETIAQEVLKDLKMQGIYGMLW